MQGVVYIINLSSQQSYKWYYNLWFLTCRIKQKENNLYINKYIINGKYILSYFFLFFLSILKKDKNKAKVCDTYCLVLFLSKWYREVQSFLGLCLFKYIQR